MTASDYRQDNSCKRASIMGTDMLVSIVIPTRNRCALLARALASIQAQTHVHWEALVIDDGSEDDTAEMMAGMKDDRIRFFPSTEQSGSGQARADGARASRGDYIAYLDSDDYWLATKLERQLMRARACTDADTVVLGPPLTLRGNALYKSVQPPLDTGRQVSVQSIADYIYAHTNATLQTSGLLISGELGRRVRFDPDLYVNQDTDYLLRLAAAGACFVYLDEHLYVQDANDRGDRISADRALLQESLAWFEALSPQWSPTARRGYYFVDACIRSARQGRVGLGLWYYLRGFDRRRGAYALLHQLLRVLGRGDVPRSISRLGRRTGFNRGQRAD